MLNNATGFKHIYIATGYTDLRKSIDALAYDACRKLHKTLYSRMFELISDIKHMETQRLKRRYVNPDVLVIDDFANTKMTEEDRRLKRMVSV